MDGRIGIAQKSPIVPAGDSGIPTVELPGGTHHVEKKGNKANPPSGNDAAKKTRRDPASSSENRTDPADLEILEESREMVEAQLKFCNAYSTMADFRLAHYDYTMELFCRDHIKERSDAVRKELEEAQQKREFLLKNRDILFKKLQEQEFAVTADKIDAYVVKRMVDAGYKGTGAAGAVSHLVFRAGIG